MSADTTDRTVRFWMDSVATLAALIGLAVLVWMNWGRIFPPPPVLPEAPVSLAGATLRGDHTAPVVLIEYSDYLCPFCLRFEEDVLPALQQRYIETGRVQLAFKHHPIERIHPGATRAAEAAICAARQDQFLPMHAALFREPAGLDDARLVRLAGELGLDSDAFSQCLASDAAEQVQRDVEEAQALGLSGTPAFLIGRRMTDGTVQVTAVVNGARPAAEFEAAIDAALAPPVFSSSRVAVLVAGGGMGTMAVVWLWYRRNQSSQTV